MSVTQRRILLVEDDRRIRTEILDALRAVGYGLQFADCFVEARLLLQQDHDLLLLDLGLPDGDGLDLIRELRACGRALPILVISARDRPDQRVRGLDVGADDYIVKPFHMPELLARIATTLRRLDAWPGGVKLRSGTLWLNADSRCVGRGDELIAVTPREFDLLFFLMSNPDRTFTREQLLDRVWGARFDGLRRTVDLHVARLRAAIERNPVDPQFIRTVWGVGYRFVDGE